MSEFKYPGGYPKGDPFAVLLRWHMDHGTRSNTTPGSIGDVWDENTLSDEFSRRNPNNERIKNADPRTIINWFTGKTRPTPRKFGILTKILFGNEEINKNLRDDFLRAYRVLTQSGAKSDDNTSSDIKPGGDHQNATQDTGRAGEEEGDNASDGSVSAPVVSDQKPAVLGESDGTAAASPIAAEIPSDIGGEGATGSETLVAEVIFDLPPAPIAAPNDIDANSRVVKTVPAAAMPAQAEIPNRMLSSIIAAKVIPSDTGVGSKRRDARAKGPMRSPIYVRLVVALVTLAFFVFISSLSVGPEVFPDGESSGGGGMDIPLPPRPKPSNNRGINPSDQPVATSLEGETSGGGGSDLVKKPKKPPIPLPPVIVPMPYAQEPPKVVNRDQSKLPATPDIPSSPSVTPSSPSQALTPNPGDGVSPIVPSPAMLPPVSVPVPPEPPTVSPPKGVETGTAQPSTPPPVISPDKPSTASELTTLTPTPPPTKLRHRPKPKKQSLTNPSKDLNNTQNSHSNNNCTNCDK